MNLTREQVTALRKASAVLSGTGHHDEASEINRILAQPDHSGDGGEKAHRVAGELYAISNDMRYQNNRRAIFEAILAREYGDPVAEIFDRQDAGFERCYEALGITDDRERSWSSLVMAINDAQADPQDGDQRARYRWSQDGEGWFVVTGPGYPQDCFFSGQGQAEKMAEFLNQAALVSSKAAAVAARPTDDALWDQTLTERDNYHEWADKLANAIAEHFGVEIGEHSGANNPWSVALEALEDMVEPIAHAWRTTEPSVCAPMTEDPGVAALWREAGFDVIDLSESMPVAAAVAVGGPIHQARLLTDEEGTWGDCYEATFYACKAYPDKYQTRIVYATPPAPIASAEEGVPIPMLLFCPQCGTQHVDAPEPAEIFDTGNGSRYEVNPDRWLNPPHRSHKCHACECIWRPADVATTGVETIATVGKLDNWDGPPSVASHPAAAQPSRAEVLELREAARQFHNLTQGDSTVIIRPSSAEKRDAIVAAGERLRAALTDLSGAETDG